MCRSVKAGHLKSVGRKGFRDDCETSHHSRGVSGYSLTSWREREVELDSRVALSLRQLSCAAARA